MEEIVALDSSKQKQFVKSIKGIKKLITKSDKKGADGVKDGKVKKKKRSSRGLVYLGHIPHGFYENEMTQYFKQFGMVTNVRVIRSKRTGNSKGFAFVEFKDTAVAEIVAETMNNYLMGKRLIKAAYIPPEKQRRHSKRKFWSTSFNPASEARLKIKKAYNATKNEKEDLQKAKKLLSNLTKTKKKLSDLGIEYDFMPVDVPEPLQHLLSKPGVKQEQDVPKGKVGKKIKKETKNDEIKEEKKKDKKKQVAPKQNEKLQVKKEVTPKVEEKVSKNKKPKAEVKVNQKEQAQKDKKLKEAGVKPMGNFIKIGQESDGDSDSSYAFDSDEFEKLLGNESDVGSDDSESEDDDNDSDDAEELESKEETPKKQKRAPKAPLVKAPKQEIKVKDSKRKASQAIPVSPKKSKFENRNTQKLAKKQFKKKK